MTVTHSPTTTAGERTDAGQLLRMILRENAAFSVLSGAVLAGGSFALDSWLGVHWAWPLAIGLGLLAYGPMLWIGSSRPQDLVTTGRLAVAGDIGWVAASIVIVAATDWLTSNGDLALLAVTAIVAIFAIGQAIGLRRLTR